MKNAKELFCCFSAVILWGLGAGLLLVIWRYQQALPDPLGAYIKFTLMFVATFYVLALFPIKHCLDRIFSHTGSSTQVHGHR